MTELSEDLGFNFHSVFCYKDASLDRWTFSYLPGEPEPDLDPFGKPMITVWVSDRGAMLQLQTRWDVKQEVLTELRHEISRRHPQLDADLLSLTGASLNRLEATLILGNGQEQFHELQTISSSGVPPYIATLNVQLTTEDKAKALAALNGQKSYLMVTYRFSLTTTASITAAIQGDVAADIQTLCSPETTDTEDSAEPSSLFASLLGSEKKESRKQAEINVTLEDCFAQIEVALTAGRLTLTRVEQGNVSDLLRQKADTSVKQTAAHQLLATVKGLSGTTKLPDESRLNTTATQTETQQYSGDRTTDISTWFPSGNGLEQINVSPTSIEEPTTAPVSEPSDLGAIAPAATGKTEKTVRLGFDAKDSPVYSIDVTCGENTEILRHPSFKSVTLPHMAGESLQIETKYTKGGKSFKTELTPSLEEWVLNPEHLGLVKVVVDASRPKASKAKSVQVTVLYKPAKAGNGTRDTHYVTFNVNQEEWLDSWYIITRDLTLSGVIEWFWLETPAKGSATRHPSVETDNPELKL
jgi:hypothetical protein